MGLDWRPLGKPKAGFEERYNQLFRLIQETDEQQLEGEKKSKKIELLDEWSKIQIPSYETIKAPRVGRDNVADDWLKKKYDETDKSISLEEFIQDHSGYYVVELAKELDGVPMYVAMAQDRNVFRGQFLDDCKDIIGEELYNEAWVTKLADETLEYGQQLMAIADRIATKNNLLYLKEERIPPDSDEDSLKNKIHILYSAAKWLIFYGKNGHGYEADF